MSGRVKGWRTGRSPAAWPRTPSPSLLGSHRGVQGWPWVASTSPRTSIVLSASCPPAPWAMSWHVPLTPPPRMNASWAGCPDGTTKQLCSGTPQEQSESHCPVVACPTSPALPAPRASGLGHSVTGTWDRPAELSAESPEGQSS